MRKTKIIAYFLPQFHEIEENNIWWGKGFTEWTNVKSAKSLYKGHIQPRIPNKYYSLMDKETVVEQTLLAKKYGVYGFAYYHYWFNGRLIMEKPAENLLKWKDINQKFFFYWANHNWYKSVDNIKQILIKQEYAGKKDWINHYNYMKPFFKDQRYIKLDNKPVIGLYMPVDIPDLDNMINTWEGLAKEDGFNGVYVMGSINRLKERRTSEKINAMMIRQPTLAHSMYFRRNIFKGFEVFLRQKFIKNPKKPLIVDYKKVARYQKKCDINLDCDAYYCVGTGWDNTPRHLNRGMSTKNESPKLFYEILSALYNKSLKKGYEFLFINAWNEWAEGMYLEPDKRFGYKYLEAIKRVVEKSDK